MLTIHTIHFFFLCLLLFIYTTDRKYENAAIDEYNLYGGTLIMKTTPPNANTNHFQIVYVHL